MKYLLSIVLISCLSFTYINYEASNRTAEVEQYQGLHIFVSSQPVMDYEYLGTVSVSIAWSAQFEGVKNKLIKKGKIKYPQADGIILKFNNGGSDRADLIKFK